MWSCWCGNVNDSTEMICGICFRSEDDSEEEYKDTFKKIDEDMKRTDCLYHTWYQEDCVICNPSKNESEVNNDE